MQQIVAGGSRSEPWLASPPMAYTPDAVAITRAASAQTYTIIRLLADRERVADAYRAYAYFRWVDDRLDDAATSAAGRAAFLARQQALLDAAYAGRRLPDLAPEETLLARLIAGDTEPDSGLQSYLRGMMAVMAIDVARRGRPISAAELDRHVETLAAAVADALYHFIDHDHRPPREPARYTAVRGANIIHMLRDAAEDLALGYYNVPAEYLAAHGLSLTMPADELLASPAYRAWVAGRVRLARACFAAGRAYLAALPGRRRRLASYAYIARFEWVARLIERDGYHLRAEYPERKSAAAALWMAWRTAGSALWPRRAGDALRPATEA